MYKKFSLFFVLLIVFVLALSGCGDNGTLMSSPGGNASPGANTSSGANASQTVSQTASPAASNGSQGAVESIISALESAVA